MTNDPSASFNTSLVLGGKEFDPAACTEATGLQPINVWRQQRADLVDHPALVNIEWCIGRNSRRLYSVDDAAREVLDIVWPKRESIKRFAEENELEISLICNVTINDDRPEYVLSHETMSMLVWFGAKFGLDIFDYTEEG